MGEIGEPERGFGDISDFGDLVDFEEELKLEGERMGRGVTFRRGWQALVKGRDGMERMLRVMIYETEPIEHGTITLNEVRWVLWDASGREHGGILESGGEGAS